MRLFPGVALSLALLATAHAQDPAEPATRQSPSVGELYSTPVSQRPAAPATPAPPVKPAKNKKSKLRPHLRLDSSVVAPLVVTAAAAESFSKQARANTRQQNLLAASSPTVTATPSPTSDTGTTTSEPVSAPSTNPSSLLPRRTFQGNALPEPTSLALAGVGLFGISALRRRRGG